MLLNSTSILDLRLLTLVSRWSIFSTFMFLGKLRDHCFYLVDPTSHDDASSGLHGPWTHQKGYLIVMPL